MNLPDPFYRLHEHAAIDLPGARAVFTTRRGGHSEGPYASLNLGLMTDDAPARVSANEEQLRDLLGVPLARCRQVHGTDIVQADSVPGAPPQADGQVTTAAGLALMVLVADCLPIVLAGPGAVAVVHAGWRGLAGGIIERGVRALRDVGVQGAVSAAIGPGVGGCCYEVGPEVQEAFANYGSEVRDGPRLDLKAIATQTLARAGVGQTYDVGLCTMCAERSLFFSHRRDRGITGRQAGVAWLS
jgi:purine-nucleoside/S-methyl-5'-thioadenosine phosphorylase / adenosine deaminase